MASGSRRGDHEIDDGEGPFAEVEQRRALTINLFNYESAKVEVGASYLNDPEEVSSVLIKVGKMAMNDIVDVRGRHLIVQEKCPYIKNQNIHVP